MLHKLMIAVLGAVAGMESFHTQAGRTRDMAVG